MGRLLRAARLEAIRGVVHGFETRQAQLSEDLPQPPTRVRQVHGAEVRFLRSESSLARYRSTRMNDWPPADGLVTAVQGITLAVATADCLPVLIADRDGQAVGAAHAGWRGLALGILPTTLAIMARELGIQPRQCVAALGPRIGLQAYRVGEDVLVAFRAAGIAAGVFSQPREEPGDNGAGTTWLCDLAAAARLQLQACGLEEANIEALDACTFSERERFHSWRRDGAAAGRMLAGIALG